MKYEEFNTPFELYNYMKENIKYGFISKIDGKHYRRNELQDNVFYDYMIKNGYYLQTPKELINSKYGICYDQVELIRDWLIKHNYKVYTFFSTYHNHAFIVYEDNDKYYLFERSFPKYNGIYEANSLDEILCIYKQIQIEEMKDFVDEINIYPYKNVVFHCSFNDFIMNATSNISKKIVLKVSE